MRCGSGVRRPISSKPDTIYNVKIWGAELRIRSCVGGKLTEVENTLGKVKATAEADKLGFPSNGLTKGPMGIAEKIYQVVKDLPDLQAAEILGFAENVKARSATVVPAQRRVDLTLFRRHRGRHNGTRINRDELYDRAGLR